MFQNTTKNMQRSLPHQDARVFFVASDSEILANILKNHPKLYLIKYLLKPLLKSAWKKNYFTSSDPHHDMLGGGCQVRVVIENMMGRMENFKTLISGFLGLVILVRWALVTMFLS